MRDIEVNEIQAAFFHFKVDGTGNDIAGCQLGARIVLRHEALAGFAFFRQAEKATFTANGFGNQIRFGGRVIQTGRVKLDKFHIGDAAAGTPAHRHPVTGGHVGVGGI